VSGVVHWRSIGYLVSPGVSACGLKPGEFIATSPPTLENGQYVRGQSRTMTRKPFKLTDDPREVTCKQCLKNHQLRESLGHFPKVELRSASFQLSWPPDVERRTLTIITLPMTPEEVEVAMDVLLERLGPWLMGEGD